MKIQSLVDSLRETGERISTRKHLDIIIEGLSQEYESTISRICKKFGRLIEGSRDTPSLPQISLG